MAFKDITRVFYDGQMKIDYKDKIHRYYARPRINWDMSEDNPKAWGKVIYPKGVTTLIGDTLEKKGLMQWPKNVALRELFGYYSSFEIESDDGEMRKMPAGFSKGVGTIWARQENDGSPIVGKLADLSREDVMVVVKSADKGWQRKQKKGADIGSVVHDAIEHFINNQDFDIAESYAWNIKESEYDSEALREKAMEEFDEDVAMATKAFLRFQKWWYTSTPVLHSAEDILYAMNLVHVKNDVMCGNRDVNGNCHCQDLCGTYDADLSIDRNKHPIFGKVWDESMYITPAQHARFNDSLGDRSSIRCVTDWKTSNASPSKEAAAPEGVYYSYFLQDALYELMRRALGQEPADDLLVVSARKDGEFSLIYASECGLTVEECLEWAKAVMFCYHIADKTKGGLLVHMTEQEAVDAPKENEEIKEEF